MDYDAAVKANGTETVLIHLYIPILCGRLGMPLFFDYSLHKSKGIVGSKNVIRIVKNKGIPYP